MRQATLPPRRRGNRAGASSSYRRMKSGLPRIKAACSSGGACVTARWVLQHGFDIAAGLLESRGKPIDEGRRRLVGDKVLRQLEGDMTRGRRAFREQIERGLTFRLAIAGDVLAEKMLVAIVVTRGIEHEP